MEYKTFALKWRPKDFDEVIGQEHIVTNLKNAILRDRLPHAFLFSGPHGVGKTSTARILAKSLNCKDGPTVKPCQKCSNCIEINEGRSLDIIEIDGASNRGIDEVRALRENVKFPPTKSKFKIYIIDEVHMLTEPAFNALLKTLEEPPPFVKFIFATTQPHKVIPTIVSRCQRFHFKRIPIDKIIEQLKKIILEQNIDIDEEILFSVAKASHGSLRDAESILDQLISFKKDTLSLEDLMTILGIVDIEVLFSLTERIIHKDPKGIIEFLNKIIEEGKDLGVVLNGLIEHFRNLLVAKISKEDFSILDMPLEICQRLYQQSLFFSIEEIMYFFNTLVNIQEMTKKVDSLSIPLEVGLIKLSQEKKAVIKEPTKEQKIREDVVAHREIVPDTSYNDIEIAKDKDSVNLKSSKEIVSPIITLEQIKEHWSELIEALKKIKMSVASYLTEGFIEELRDDTLIISFAKNNSFHKEILEQKHNKNLIEKTIEDIFKKNIKINFIISKDQSLEKEEDNPIIKTIIETFNAKTLNKE